MMIYTYSHLLKQEQDLKDCGGKARNLYLLKKMGYPVPNFIVIPHPMIRNELKHLQEDIHSLLDNLKGQMDDSIIRVATEIQSKVRQHNFINTFYDSLFHQIAREFGQNYSLAVRSSNNMEDGRSNSFAGIFDSFLFVKKDEVLEKVKACIASSYHERVLKYMILRDIDPTKGEIAIIIQEMIDSAKAGVLFTRNPEGNLDEMVICSAFGQGEGVVQGTSETESYFIHRSNRSARIEPVKLEKDLVLSKKEISHLFELGEKIESVFGKPQDIEFAIDKKGKIHLLQSRDITTIQMSDIKILDNSNIVESYPGLSLPLTYTFAKKAYEGTLKSAAKYFKFSPVDQEQLAIIFPDLINQVHGRIYYNLHHWYTMVRLIQNSDKGIRSWEEFIGLAHADEKKQNLSYLKKITRIFQLFRLYWKHDQNCNQFFTRFKNEYSAFRSFLTNLTIHPVSTEELFAYYSLKSQYWLSFWGITLINDVFVHRFFNLLKDLVSSYGFDDQENLTNDLLCGIEGVESEKPVTKILELKASILENPLLIELFKKSTAEILKEMKEEEHSSFAKDFFSYIELYGDRGLEELKLESINFRMRPDLLVHMIKNYLENPIELNTFKEKQLKIRVQAEARIEARQGINPIKKWWFNYILQKTKNFIKNRENMRFARTRAYSLIRELFLEIATLMVQSGTISEKSDIFYLNMSELKAHCQGIDQGNKKTKIEKCKAQYTSFKKMKLPDRIVYTGDQLPILSTIDQEDQKIVDQLRGTAISKGEIAAEAIVLQHPNLGINVKGKILITKMTDPGWIFLMAQAKGIISEKGSPLSHTAIVGRELGIPTIVNVKNATTLIKSGQQIHMNGNTGLITLKQN